MIGIQLESIEGQPYYDLAINVCRNAQGQITGGLCIGRTDEQNIALLLKSSLGDYKEAPTMGVGLGNMLQDNDLDHWKHTIQQQLETEGIIIDKLSLTHADGLQLEAHYKQ